MKICLLFALYLSTAHSQEVVTSRPAVQQMNTATSLSCVLEDAPDDVLINQAIWKRGSDGKLVVDSDPGFAITESQSGKDMTSILEISGDINTQDDTYTCEFTVGDDPQNPSSSWQGTCRVFLFLVTPHDVTVNREETATLSCVITDIVKNLTVTWETNTGQIAGEVQGHSTVQGTNTGGVQTSVLTIDNVTESGDYTCTLYPYADQPYSTEVRLLVNTGAGRVSSIILFATCIFLALFV